MLRTISAFFASYVRLIVFAVAVLIGVQVPGFIAQYQAIVNAHLLEAEQNLLGFQQTANRHFGGDIGKLFEHYRASNDAVFIDDATNIQSIFDRVNMLSQESAMFKQHPLTVGAKVALRFNQPLFTETVNAYQWVVPLHPNAVFWGLGLALIIVLLVDSFFWGVRALIKGIFNNKPARQKPR